ncbi:hypothetical protein BDP27DRAFT_426208 [Rhodocollybia butyracea]|uniref:C2H2-type domain-containing protein n=1 Tax=Rhodocollybia butyracea TaxID=206335 RepID=A0A9P5PYL6_9AGAR|nr:hypothetical protein BDP27DRAFT_426208 [Rhodocollybia butyracea]
MTKVSQKHRGCYAIFLKPLYPPLTGLVFDTLTTSFTTHLHLYIVLEMLFGSVPATRAQISYHYAQYCHRWYFLHRSGKPCTMEMWYSFAQVYSGSEQEFEAWLWGVPVLPYIPSSHQYPVDDDAMTPGPQFHCFSHECTKKYLSRQSRDNHFDSTHLGMRFGCQFCGNLFMNRNSVRRHETQRCPRRP